jgi:hypothetical protein
MLLLFSALGIHQFVDLSFHPLSLSVTVPLLVGAIGGLAIFVGGEIDRKKKAHDDNLDRTYKAVFFLSAGALVFSIILGAVMNPQVAVATLSELPYIAAGMALLGVVSFAILKAKSLAPLPTDDTKEPTIV